MERLRSMRFVSAAILTLVGMTASPAALTQNGEAPRLPYEGTLSIISTYGLVDVGTILSSWRILGALACPTLEGGIRACLLVENAYPCGIFEVIRQRGRTHYAEMGGVLALLGSFTLFGKSSSETARAAAGDSLQFADTRVYGFVPDLGLANSGVPLAIPQGTTFQVSYVSELDGFGWRKPLVDELVAPQSVIARLKSCDRIPDPKNCAGSWGSYWPRVGSIENPSQVMAAHVQALRAGRAASAPLGRVVLETYAYEPRTGHYIQMIRPTYRTAITIGSPLITLYERGAGSSYGAYAFLHYGIFFACDG
jgi:hypothetical protein